MDDRRRIKDQLKGRLFRHFSDSLPTSIHAKLSPVEYNVIITSFIEFLYADKADAIQLAMALVRVLNEDNKPIIEKAVNEAGFLKELDKL